MSGGIYTGAGFTLNGSVATRTVTIDAGNNSLQGIRDAINAANVGVTASILNVGGPTPYRLVLQSAAGGSATSLRVGVSGDAALQSLLAYDPAATQNLTQTVAAQDANLSVNGLAVTSGSNTLTDAIQGVTLSLGKVGTTSVTIGRDPAAAQLAVQGFVKAYNDLNTLAVDITQVATPGQLVGSAAAALTVTAAVNDALTVTVDGTSASVTLPAGTYTATGLAAQVQSLINASGTLSALNAQVTVSEAAGVLTLTSKRYGSGSHVSVSGSAAAALFGAAPSAIPGVDVAGTIGGFSAIGSGQRLTAASGGPTTGLVLEISGGSIGTRGTVSFARGYAARLEALLQGVLGSDGAIASRTTGINATIKDLDRQRDVLDRRLAQIEERYRKQFTALDTLMSSMTATSAFLTQQLDQLQRLRSSSE